MGEYIDLTADDIDSALARSNKRRREPDTFAQKVYNTLCLGNNLPSAPSTHVIPSSQPAAADPSAEILEHVREIRAKIEAPPPPAAAAAAAIIPTTSTISDSTAAEPPPVPATSETSTDPATTELLAEVIRLTTQVSSVTDKLDHHITRIEKKLHNFDERIGGMEKVMYELQSNRR